MTKFGERLLQAARHAGVGDSQSEIADSLGLSKQTVHHWFTKGFPTVDNLALVERKWGINGEWLRSGEGEMLATPDGLPDDEVKLLKEYRKATPERRPSIIAVVTAMRKAIVAVTFVLPGFMAPKDADAAICHKTSCDILRAAAGHITDCISQLVSALRNVRRYFYGPKSGTGYEAISLSPA